MGAWAHDEKKKYSDLDSLAFDPSILLITVGCLMFVFTFCGCIGALRENKLLLQIVSKTLFIAKINLLHLKFNKITKTEKSVIRLESYGNTKLSKTLTNVAINFMK